MDRWERFDETSLPSKESFYSELNLEDITNEDWNDPKQVWDTFNIENLGGFHDLYVQSEHYYLLTYSKTSETNA